MKKILCAIALLVLTVPMAATAGAHNMNNGNSVPYTGRPTNYNVYNQPGFMMGHVQTRLYSVNGSSVQGFADLRQIPNHMGTRITVVAFGLQPGNTYVSLYYSNHVCALEPYSVNDVIGGIYTANAGGVGATIGNADDNLSEINSVSVRVAGTFALLACGNVHSY